MALEKTHPPMSDWESEIIAFYLHDRYLRDEVCSLFQITATRLRELERIYWTTLGYRSSP